MMKRKIVILMSLVGVFIFSFRFTWAYLKDTVEIKDKEISITAINKNGLECQIDSESNLDFTNTTSTDSKIINLTVNNQTSLFLNELEFSLLLSNSTGSSNIDWKTYYNIEYSLDNGNSWNSFSDILKISKNIDPNKTFSLKLRLTQKKSMDSNVNANQFGLNLLAKSVGGETMQLAKSMLITPRKGPSFNTLNSILDYHIVAKDSVSISTSSVGDINLATNNLTMSNNLQISGLTAYVNKFNAFPTNIGYDANSRLILGNSDDESYLKDRYRTLSIINNPNFLNLNQIFGELQEINKSIDEMNTNSSYKTDSNQIILKNIPGMSIIDINSEEFDNNTNAQVQLANKDNRDLLVINVITDDGKVDMPSFDLNEENAKHILWNVVNTSQNRVQVNISKSFYGTILAPQKDSVINISASNYYGGMIASNVNISGSTKRVKLEIPALN